MLGPQSTWLFGRLLRPTGGLWEAWTLLLRITHWLALGHGGERSALGFWLSHDSLVGYKLQHELSQLWPRLLHVTAWHWIWGGQDWRKGSMLVCRGTCIQTYKEELTSILKLFPKNWRGWNTHKFILWGHHYSNTKNRETLQRKKINRPISLMNIDTKISKIQKVLYRVLFGECVLKSNVFLSLTKLV